MFRTFTKLFLPNRLDYLLKKTKKKGGKKILLGWNRGLGDIALGLYAIVHRIRSIIPDAEITFVTRHNLYDGFSLLEGVHVLVDPSWERKESYHIDEDLKKNYDLVIEKPSPTDWVAWQRGALTPKLKWNPAIDSLHERFNLPPHSIGVQPCSESGYASWRDFPKEKWQQLFDQMPEKTFLLFGFAQDVQFHGDNLIDLRGATSFFELLSIIKNRAEALILPDSGISSIVYYLDICFKIKHITLWADPNHGILKQAVSSPNPQLIHRPLIAPHKNLSELPVEVVKEALRKKPLALLLAAGQGTRLGWKGPKGLFKIGGKTLFERFCQKMDPQVPLAIMTSPMNHEEIKEYFKKNQNFGLQVTFFQQEVAPILDENFCPLTEMSPIGNGNVFASFMKADLCEFFKKQEIEKVIVSYIDNPLSHPLDPELLNVNEKVSIQCILREKTDSFLGALTPKEGGFEVIEYTELDSQKDYPYAYSGQMAFDFDFFCEMGNKKLEMHTVQKKMCGKKVWKKEQFIFDVLKFTKSVCPVVVDRKTHYAPVKDLQGALKAEEVFASL